MSDGISRGPIPAGHGFVDRGQMRAAQGFHAIPDSPLAHRNVKHGKILVTDKIHAGRVSRTCDPVQDFKSLVDAIEWRRSVERIRYRDNFGQSLHTGAEPVDIAAACLLSIMTAGVNGYANVHGVLRIVAEVRMNEPE